MAYATVADVRAVSVADAVGDESEFADAILTSGIAYATDLVDEYCGTSFESKAHVITLDGNGLRAIQLTHWETGRPVFYPRSITAVTIDDTAVSNTEYDTWKLHPHGLVVRSSGNFPYDNQGQNVVISITAYRTSSPSEHIKHAVCLVARDWVLQTADRTHRRALQETDSAGLIVLAQPGKRGPTGMPLVDKILTDARVRFKGFA